MKELTIEQKAQRYDEAIERARIHYNTTDSVADAELIELIFPELKESDDEKIRKEIIAILQYKYEKYPNDPKYCNAPQWIAWLEKQGEQKPVFEMKTPEESLGIDSETYNKIVDECIYGDAKQNHAWSEDDEVKINRIVACLENLNVADNDIILKDVDWLKSLKDRVLPKQEWNEDDEKIYKSITYSFAHNYPLTVQQQEFVKSLKGRVQPQPKQEWSEEDESYLKTTIVYLKDAKEFKKTAENCINWLNSLKPQKQWKPSDEQIEILDMVLTNESMDDNIARILRELREQLKKLKG